MNNLHIHNLNVTISSMNYLLNTSYHHQEMLRHIISMFSVIETKPEWSSGYYGILYCSKTVYQCDDKYTMFQLRRDMRDKLDENLFMKKLKSSLKICQMLMTTFVKNDCSKESLTVLKKNIYVKEMEKRNYLTKEHKFDDKLCLTVLSLMYKKITFYCYSPLDFDLFIYNFDRNKQQTLIIRTHIYENSIPGINIFLMKKPTKQQQKRRIFSMFNAHNENSGKII